MRIPRHKVRILRCPRSRRLWWTLFWRLLWTDSPRPRNLRPWNPLKILMTRHIALNLRPHCMSK